MNPYVKELKILDKSGHKRLSSNDSRELTRHNLLQSDYYRMIREERIKEEQQSSMEYSFAVQGVGPDSDGDSNNKIKFGLFFELP